MAIFCKKSKISTLGPAKTNSHFAAKAYMDSQGISGEPLLCQTAEDSFEALLSDVAQGCVVCNLYPDIHKLYIPHLHEVTVCDVFINAARMGLYKRVGVASVETVACPITSTVFVRGESFKVVVCASNAEAAAMCKAGNVDAAISTTDAANDNNLSPVRQYAAFAVPYSVFMKSGNR